MQLLPQAFPKRIILLIATFLVVSFFSSMGYSQTCNSNNVAANKPTVASDGNEMAGNVVDGSLATDWYGAEDSKWLYVDLGSSQNLCKVTVKMGIWSNIPQIVIQGSDNTSTWTTLYTIASNSSANHLNNYENPALSYDYIDVDLSSLTTAYRYVRLYYPSGVPWGPHLKEFEVYTKDAVPTPVVNINSPADQSTFSQGSNITFTATASETGGTISKVEFFANNILLGQDLTTPYSLTWNNVQAGDYTIVAKAQDALGQNATHTITIHITVPTSASAWSLIGNSSTTSNHFLGTTDNNPIIFKTNGAESFRITSTGQVSIGTTDPKAYKLAVNGDAIFTRITVKQNSTWPDYVFKTNYRLLSLSEVEAYIKKFQHLPDVPSASDVQNNGLDVGDNQAVLLRKIEELTLYIIEQDKKIESLQVQNKDLLEIKKGLENIKAKLKN
jgi:hypothetical protein